jgi:serine/threonine-protein kinase
MTTERSLLVAIQSARALSAAHKAGILHRDLKPANIYLTQTDDRADFVKVIDFGISKLVHTRSKIVTSASLVLGTPYYMSPEQAKNSGVDARADIYSLGVIMYEMLTGRRPFDGDSALEILTKHATDRPPPPSAVAPEFRFSPEIDALVMRALEKDRDQRFANMDELSNAALECLETIAPNAMTDSLVHWRQSTKEEVLFSSSETPEPTTFLNRGKILWAGAAALLAGLVVVFALQSGDAEVEPAGAKSRKTKKRTKPKRRARSKPRGVVTEW